MWSVYFILLNIYLFNDTLITFLSIVSSASNMYKSNVDTVLPGHTAHDTSCLYSYISSLAGEK